MRIEGYDDRLSLLLRDIAVIEDPDGGPELTHILSQKELG